MLRPQTRLDLILDVDLLNDFIDVRTTNVLEINAQSIIISQPDPPVFKSMIGRNMEATFVKRDPVSSEMVRWGWRAEITDLISNYKVRADDENSAQVVSLSRPLENQGLSPTNARMDYRLAIRSDTKISIQTHPSFGRISLLDFSAGGMLIGIPRPPQATVGMQLWFTLIFPTQPGLDQPTSVSGEGKVVRIKVEDGDRLAQVGLQFLNLDLSATRTLQKIINHYMLEEQRSRNRY